MNKKSLYILAGALSTATIVPAEATLITGSAIAESSVIEDDTISDFVWNFTGLMSGTGLAILDLDYTRLDTDASGEYLKVFIDGTLIGNTRSTTNLNCVIGNDATHGVFSSDCDGSQSFSFDTSGLSDGTLDIVVSSGGVSPVNSYIDTGSGAGFASISIEYNPASVPEPITFSLLSIALAGLGFSRYKKKLQE